MDIITLANRAAIVNKYPEMSLAYYIESRKSILFLTYVKNRWAKGPNKEIDYDYLVLADLPIHEFNLKLYTYIISN